MFYVYIRAHTIQIAIDSLFLSKHIYIYILVQGRRRERCVVCIYRTHTIPIVIDILFLSLHMHIYIYILYRV